MNEVYLNTFVFLFFAVDNKGKDGQPASEK